MDNKSKKSKPEKKVEKKIKKEIIKETKKVNKKNLKKETKTDIEKSLKEPFLEDIEAIREEKNKKLVSKIELIIVIIFSVIMLILLCNRTFFRTNYKNSKMKIDIPLLMFFKKDDGNKLVLKTLRKTKYIKDYFGDKLYNLTRYDCNGYTFYYDENNQYAIYDINIEKDFVVKTVTIEYAAGSADCLCHVANNNLYGKEAEEACNKGL